MLQGVPEPNPSHVDVNLEVKAIERMIEPPRVAGPRRGQFVFVLGIVLAVHAVLFLLLVILDAILLPRETRTQEMQVEVMSNRHRPHRRHSRSRKPQAKEEKPPEEKPKEKPPQEKPKHQQQPYEEPATDAPHKESPREDQPPGAGQGDQGAAQGAAVRSDRAKALAREAAEPCRGRRARSLARASGA